MITVLLLNNDELSRCLQEKIIDDGYRWPDPSSGAIDIPHNVTAPILVLESDDMCLTFRDNITELSNLRRKRIDYYIDLR